MEVKSLIDINALADGTNVVKLFASWCGPCRLYASAYERVASKNPDAGFYEVDIDQQPDLKKMWDVQTVPTTLVFKDGELLAKQPGALSTKGLTDVLSLVHDRT